ncbi:CHAT domain-containing protein [Gordonia malaquae]|nr:CHAT domain-containing protein [Gordonia malaquae]
MDDLERVCRLPSAPNAVANRELNLVSHLTLPADICDTDAMEKVLVWVCAPELSFAADEVSSIIRLRSADFKVMDTDVDWPDLARVVSGFRPTIFHFIGHGDASGNVMVPENGHRVGYNAVRVIRTISAASAELTGVFLSGCYSVGAGPDLAQSLTPAGGWVIGTRTGVDDDLAKYFAERFYSHLSGSAQSPHEAFEVARCYADTIWEDEVPHAIWSEFSRLPPVSEMSRTIYTCIRRVFDRPAFQTPMRMELSLKDLADAMEDVIHALGTGEVRSRRYGVSSASFPAEWLNEATISKFVVGLRKKVTAAQAALKYATEGTAGDYVSPTLINFDGGQTTQVEWMKRLNDVDRKRNAVISAVNKLIADQGVGKLPSISLSFSKAEVDGAQQEP